MRSNMKFDPHIHSVYSGDSRSEVIDILIEAEKKGFNPMRNSSLEATSLLGLGWRGCFNAEEGLKHTVEILKEIM